MPSHVTLGSSQVGIKDADLILVIQLLAECIDANDQLSSSWLATAREVWLHAIYESGFGLMDLSLNKLLTSDTRVRDMIGLLRQAIERARSYSPAFPIEWANQLGLAGVVYRQPIAVYYVEADLIAI
jgi:hypothetical protein